MAITLRNTKGLPLTHVELDGNFSDLNTRVTALEGVADSDNQTLTLQGTDLSISNGNTVDLSSMFTNSIALSDLSVSNSAASGSTSSLAYDSATGVFTFNPADNSNYITSTDFNQEIPGTLTAYSNSTSNYPSFTTAFEVENRGSGTTAMKLKNNTSSEDVVLLNVSGDFLIRTESQKAFRFNNDASSITFEGATADDFETTIAVTDPTADRTITFPDASGTVALTDDIPVAYSNTDTATYLNGNLDSHIIPDTNEAYDLGSAEYKFRDLYLSGNTINLGSATISSDGSAVALPQGSTIGGSETPEVDLNIAPEILEIQVDAPGAGQDTNWLWTWEQSTLPYARRTITNSNEITVPLYRQGTYTLNNFAKTLHGEMTQTHTIFLKWIDSAGSENLVDWAIDQGIVQDSHPSINDGNPQDVQRLSIVVPDTIVLPELVAPTTVEYTIENNGAGAYTFSGAAAGDNVNIGPIYRGGTYTFNISATGHPFYFTTDNGSNYASGTYFGEYTNGVTGSRTDSGTITFTVPLDAPDTLYYQCGNHSPMRGQITVKDLAVETNINGNYVIYAMHGQEGHKTPIEIRPIPTLVNQMCLVYDSSVNKFVPQDLATYVENTPSFENKIREVAGTAELVVEDGSAVVAKVNVYNDSTYLPLVGNNVGDQAFATDNNTLYVWSGTSWTSTKRQLVAGTNITLTTDSNGDITVTGQPGYTDTDVGNYLSTNGYDTATNIIASITDSAPETLDTLNELAAALGDDPDFATTTANNIATKMPIAGGTFTGNVTVDGEFGADEIISVEGAPLTGVGFRPSIILSAVSALANGQIPATPTWGNTSYLQTVGSAAGGSLKIVAGDNIVQFQSNIQLKNSYDLIFEGATDNDFETTVTVEDPTADRTITLPNKSGTVMLELFDDTNPRLSADLNLDSNDIVGTGTINITGGATFNSPNGSATSVRMFRNDTTPTDGDHLGYLVWGGADSNQQNQNWVVVTAKSEDVTNGTENSSLNFALLDDGEFTDYFRIDAKNYENIFYKNVHLEVNADLKFEGSTANAFETTVTAEDPTQDNTITLPDKSGTVALTNEVASPGKAIAMAMIFGG